jgi:DNA (cytosine-5)-methyltransferase 1
MIDLHAPLYTLQEASTLLNVHPETLRRLDSSGELPALRLGSRGDRRYRQQDIIRLVKQRTTSSLRVVSLFCGCGGFDLGFQGDFAYLCTYYPPTGFRIIWANDSDASALSTYRKNLHTHRVVFGNIRTIIRRRMIPDCDVVIGGFPCQDYSYSGKKQGVQTKRGRLYLLMQKVISLKQPMAFIAETVKGILHLDERKTFTTLMADFAEAGYTVTYQIYNTASYGVPQTRERVILVGIRK